MARDEMTQLGKFYRTLGVPRDATQGVIKAAYRRIAVESHPDLNPRDPRKEARFKEAAAAYEVLGDPEKRRVYDQQIAAAAAHAARRDAKAAHRTQAAAASAGTGYVPQGASRSPSTPPTAGIPWGELFTVGLGVLFAMAASETKHRGSRWDPTVQRRRGPDGRFQSTDRR